MSRSRAWCFTLNNYTDAEIEHLGGLDCRYLVYGKEVGESGTPHLQGYVVFVNPCTMAACKTKISPRAHLEKARGSHAEAATYCKKDQDFFEKGELPTQGKRSDIEALVEAINNGERSAKKLRQEHPAVMAKYSSFARQLLNDTRPKPELPAITLFQWQHDLLQLLAGPPLDRKIHWYADGEGNAGKSTFATYIEVKFDDVQVMKPGKLADLAYALDETIKILIMDCPRSREAMMPYSFLEDVKDGRVFSTKYESTTKRVGPCHVIVFSNYLPEYGKLSSDRPQVIELSLCDNLVTQVVEIDD